MSLGGFDVGTWSGAVPAGSESVGLGENRIQSVKTTLQQAIDSEHVFASGGGVVGQHRAGSARAFHGARSAVSSSGASVVENGRMMIASDATRLFGVGVEGPVMLGAGPLSLSMDSTANFFFGNQVTRWAMECGTVLSKSSTHNVTFPSSGFSGLPFLLVSVGTQIIGSNDPGRCFKLDTLTASGFSGQIVIAENGDADTAGIAWLSVGTRAL